MRRRSQRGFTLIEMMITVAVIAILAAIAIPMFSKETRKSKAKSEVGAMFGELGIRQEQYKLENGVYVATTACPATTVPTGTAAASCVTSSGPWVPLKVRLPSEKLICSYVTTIGSGTGASAPAGFTFTSPTGAWWYVVATCDGDGNTSVNASYFIASNNAAIQVQNEGR